MALSAKELEKQLMEAGNGLLSPPSSVTELLALLDRVEYFLARVEQSPCESMKKALSPSTKALISYDLLRHSNVDVKVAVASCISELTRITAPDAPYEDDQMKEVFQLIVSSFEKLDDKSSPLYIKRTSILETVAKVRSCVVMLDLECDALIAEMFQHFFRSIREDHPENVFSSMETIMTLVLEESEDISLDLLSSTLDILKTENKAVLLIARQLAEKVIEKCASKLKPYLLPAVKSCGASLDDYSKIVANVCQTGHEAVEPSDGDAASKKPADKSDLANAPSEKAVEVPMETLDDAPPNEEVVPTSVGSPKSIMSNGTLQKEIEDTSAGNDDSKEGDHDTHDCVKLVEEPRKIITESVGAEEPARSQPNKPEKSNKRKGRKTSALKSSSEPSEPSFIYDIKEAVKTPDDQGKDGKEVDSAKTGVPVTDVTESMEDVKESNAPETSQKPSENEPADVPSPSPSEDLVDESRSKKVVQGKKKNDSVQETESVSDVDSKKESSANDTSEGTGVSETKLHKRSGKKVSSLPDKEDKIPSPVDASNKEGGDTNELDVKLALHKRSGKKVSSAPAKKDKIPSPIDASNKEGDGTIELDAKLALHKRSGKKVSSAPDKEDKILCPVDASNKEGDDTNELDAKLAKRPGKKAEVVSSQREEKKKKRGQVKASPAKDLVKTPSKDVGEKPLPKSAGKSAKDLSDLEKASKTSSKRKQSPGEEKASTTKAYGPELVGSKVKVWWPDDKKYYEGVVDSFDPVEMKHKIAYNDGDIEVLKLETEKWHLIDDESIADQGHSSDGEGPDESSQTPKGKKAKTSAGLGSKRGKTESETKKGGTSSSKSKATPKSVRKQKDDSKVDGKSMEGSSKNVGKSNEGKGGKSKVIKSGNKSSDDAPKSVGKSKDDDVETPKGGNKSRQDMTKGASKSKGKIKTPKTGSKPDTNSTGKVKAGSSLKDEEDVEMSPEPAKEPKIAKGKSQSTPKSQKSGKKRKRGTKS